MKTSQHQNLVDGSVRNSKASDVQEYYKPDNNFKKLLQMLLLLGDA